MIFKIPTARKLLKAYRNLIQTLTNIPPGTKPDNSVFSELESLGELRWNGTNFILTQRAKEEMGR